MMPEKPVVAGGSGGSGNSISGLSGPVPFNHLNPFGTGNMEQRAAQQAGWEAHTAAAAAARIHALG